jgi:hypothetical protein
LLYTLKKLNPVPFGRIYPYVMHFAFTISLPA